MGLPLLSSLPKQALDFIDADTLFRAFQHPDTQAKPFVRWWWNGLRITKKK